MTRGRVHRTLIVTLARRVHHWRDMPLRLKYILSLAILGAAPVPDLRSAPDYDFSMVTPIVDSAHAELALRGSGIRVLIDGRPVYERFLGTYGADTIVPIASSTKTLSAAVILTLVDDGTLSLDDKVAKYIPSFNKPGGYADITIRQCFSHTSGLPGSEDDEALSRSDITLAESADMIAQHPLIGPPGGQFSYGGLSMQVAGRCAEVASGRPWDDLFRERICEPLGLTQVDFTTLGLLPPYRTQTNPRIAGGARCSLRDYSVFREMLRHRGIHGGRRVLSEAAVREMERDQVAGLPIIDTPSPVDTHYGIGTWIDTFDDAGQPTQTTAAGAFGFTAWIDRPRRMTVTYVAVDAYQALYPYLMLMQAALRTAIDEAPPSPTDLAARLVNLSTRTHAATGEATLITGFVVSGGTRDVLVRGIGPGLSAYQVDDPLSDPFLTLFAGPSPIASNDDWSSDDGRTLGAFALAAGSADAVLRRTLAPGGYTAQVTPATGTAPGEALDEIYDAGGGTGRLINLSARTALAARGTLIVGFVVSGAPDARKRLLLRASGPSLTGFGVAGAMTDPQLSLYDGGGTLLASNDAWSGETSLQEAFTEVSAFSFSAQDSADAALVVGLPPGNYTVHVSDRTGQSGVTLAEVYDMR